MIAEQLRKSILQAAIQGKLTEQLTEDGDARDLLNEIKKEKALLIKEGKIKKEKPLPEITDDEIPFDIPDNWCWVRLESITSVLGDGIHGTPVYDATGEYSFINGNNLIDGKIEIKNDTKHVNKSEFQKHKKMLNETTVLVSINGTIGNVAFYNYEKVILGKSTCYFNLLGKISNEYVKLLLNSDYFIKYAYTNATGSTIKNVSLQAMRNFPVPMPPIIAQEKIVEKLKRILPHILKLLDDEEKLEVIQKSFPKKMKDSILQYAIQGKLTEQLESDGDARDLLKEIQEEKERLIKEGKIKKEKPLPKIAEGEIPFDIPENWCWVRLGEVTDYGIGKQENQINIPLNSWILELEDIEKETFRLICKRNDRKPGSSKNKFDKGDILYGKLRPYLKKVIIADGAGYCSTEIIPFHGYGNIYSSYIKYCMVAPAVDGYINQITHGMDMPRLGTDKAKALVIPLPPLAEQQRIVECLDKLIPLCDTLE